MSKNSTIKIKCETPEVKKSFLEILLMAKRELAHHIGVALEQKGIPSDIKFTIQGDEITITQKSGDKGLVFVSHGIGCETVGYDTLVAPAKYMEVKDGAVVIFAKMTDGVDRPLAKFATLNEAISNVNSNDVELAFKNLVEPKQPVVLDGESSN